MLDLDLEHREYGGKHDDRDHQDHEHHEWVGELVSGSLYPVEEAVEYRLPRYFFLFHREPPCRMGHVMAIFQTWPILYVP
jgi:hypothetical protein